MGSTLKISGISSGLDTEAIVKALMDAEKVKLDKAKQQLQTLEWRQEAYRDIINDLNEFKNTYFNTTKPSTNMMSSSTYSNFTVTSSDSTNSIVKASGNSSAAEGTYNIKNISLAKKASLKGNELKGNDGKRLDIKVNDKVSSLFANDSDAKVSFSINGKDFSYDFSSTGDNKDMTISQLMSEISSTAEVSFKYSELTGSFSIESLKTGSDQKLSLSETSSSFFSTFFGDSLENLKSPDNPDSTGNTLEITGEDAKCTITDPSGGSATVTKSTNTFTIDGVSYSLVKEDDSTSGINITFNQNNNEVYSKISNFVDAYNKLIEKISNKLTEKKNYDYSPLTDAQKEAMEEDEIKKWEEKAKQGLIKGDSTLENLLTNMRTAFYTSVKECGIKLSDIGITTSSNYSKNGQLEINEDKLKKALENNKDKVIKLFTKVSETQSTYDASASSESKKARYNESGIFQRISDILLDNIRTTRDSNGYKGTLLEKAGLKGDLSEYSNSITKLIKAQQDKIYRITVQLDDKETYYYTIYSRLESTMTKLNSQSGWLSSLLGTNS